MEGLRIGNHIRTFWTTSLGRQTLGQHLSDEKAHGHPKTDAGPSRYALHAVDCDNGTKVVSPGIDGCRKCVYILRCCLCCSSVLATPLVFNIQYLTLPLRAQFLCKIPYSIKKITTQTAFSSYLVHNCISNNRHSILLASFLSPPPSLVR
jgi:hypothetical protein